MSKCIPLYTIDYIDTSVLLGNILCVKLIRNYILVLRGIHILTSEDIHDTISHISQLEMASKRLFSLTISLLRVINVKFPLQPH